jgi:outer membrane autotransporter protein
VIGGMGHTLADTQSPGQQRSVYGAVGGIDRAFEDSGLFGVYGGYQRGEVSSNAVGASADLNSYMLGAYVSHPVGAGFALSGGVSAMYHDVDTVRHVIVGGTGFSPHGSTNGSTLNAFAELAKPFQWNGTALTGFGNLSVTRNHMNGYSEHDGGAADLVVGDTTQTNPATTLGVRGSRTFGSLNIDASLGWQHTYGNLNPSATMQFAGGTTEFTSQGTPIARDAAVVGIKASHDLNQGGTAYVGYDGTLASDAQDHSFKAGLKWKF